MASELTALPLRTARPRPIAEADAWSARAELVETLDAVAHMVLVLNQQRQIVFANTAALAVIGATSPGELIGMRLGESLAGERARQAPDGCGTTSGCSTCGALLSMSNCQDGEPRDHECRLLQFGTGRALYFRVVTRSVTLDGESYLLLTLTDIAHEQRRRNLERIFFHDLLNTAGAMSGYLQLLDSVPYTERQEMTQSLLRLVGTLVDEIRSQRDLVLAENGELPVRCAEVSSLAAVKEVVTVYRSQPLAEGKFLFIAEGSRNVTLSTDRLLLIRVLGNLIKNALAASVAGEHVLVGCDSSPDGRVDFWVHNRAVMPPEVQLQMFHRAFTTKGTGRGLGTYSVRLLTSRYLKGSVSFASSKDAGTKFVVSLPLAIPPTVSARAPLTVAR
jgi:signal transduction histidine kinase